MEERDGELKGLEKDDGGGGGGGGHPVGELVEGSD